MTTLDPNGVLFQNTKDALNYFMRERGLPKQMRHDLRDYFAAARQARAQARVLAGQARTHDSSAAPLRAAHPPPRFTSIRALTTHAAPGAPDGDDVFVAELALRAPAGDDAFFLPSFFRCFSSRAFFFAFCLARFFCFRDAVAVVDGVPEPSAASVDVADGASTMLSISSTSSDI